MKQLEGKIDKFCNYFSKLSKVSSQRRHSETAVVAGWALAHDHLLLPPNEWINEDVPFESLVAEPDDHSNLVPVTLVASDKTGVVLYYINIGVAQFALGSDITLTPTLNEVTKLTSAETTRFEWRIQLVLNRTGSKRCALCFPSKELFFKWHTALREALAEMIFREAFCISNPGGEISVVALETSIQTCANYVSLNNSGVKRAKKIWNLKLELHNMLSEVLLNSDGGSFNLSDAKVCEITGLLRQVDEEPFLAEDAQVVLLRRVLTSKSPKEVASNFSPSRGTPFTPLARAKSKLARRPSQEPTGLQSAHEEGGQSAAANKSGAVVSSQIPESTAAEPIVSLPSLVNTNEIAESSLTTSTSTKTGEHWVDIPLTPATEERPKASVPDLRGLCSKFDSSYLDSSNTPEVQSLRSGRSAAAASKSSGKKKPGGPAGPRVRPSGNSSGRKRTRSAGEARPAAAAESKESGANPLTQALETPSGSCSDDRLVLISNTPFSNSGEKPVDSREVSSQKIADDIRNILNSSPFSTMGRPSKFVVDDNLCIEYSPALHLYDQEPVQTPFIPSEKLAGVAMSQVVEAVEACPSFDELLGSSEDVADRAPASIEVDMIRRDEEIHTSSGAKIAAEVFQQFETVENAGSTEQTNTNGSTAATTKRSYGIVRALAWLLCYCSLILAAVYALLFYHNAGKRFPADFSMAAFMTDNLVNFSGPGDYFSYLVSNAENNSSQMTFSKLLFEWSSMSVSSEMFVVRADTSSGSEEIIRSVSTEGAEGHLIRSQESVEQAVVDGHSHVPSADEAAGSVAKGSHEDGDAATPETVSVMTSRTDASSSLDNESGSNFLASDDIDASEEKQQEKSSDDFHGEENIASTGADDLSEKTDGEVNRSFTDLVEAAGGEDRSNKKCEKDGIAEEHLERTRDGAAANVVYFSQMISGVSNESPEGIPDSLSKVVEDQPGDGRDGEGDSNDSDGAEEHPEETSSNASKVVEDISKQKGDDNDGKEESIDSADGHPEEEPNEVAHANDDRTKKTADDAIMEEEPSDEITSEGPKTTSANGSGEDRSKRTSDGAHGEILGQSEASPETGSANHAANRTDVVGAEHLEETSGNASKDVEDCSKQTGDDKEGKEADGPEEEPNEVAHTDDGHSKKTGDNAIAEGFPKEPSDETASEEGPKTTSGDGVGGEEGEDHLKQASVGAHAEILGQSEASSDETDSANHAANRTRTDADGAEHLEKTSDNASTVVVDRSKQTGDDKEGKEVSIHSDGAADERPEEEPNEVAHTDDDRTKKKIDNAIAEAEGFPKEPSEEIISEEDPSKASGDGGGASFSIQIEEEDHPKQPKDDAADSDNRAQRTRVESAVNADTESSSPGERPDVVIGEADGSDDVLKQNSHLGGNIAEHETADLADVPRTSLWRRRTFRFGGWMKSLHQPTEDLSQQLTSELDVVDEISLSNRVAVHWNRLLPIFSRKISSFAKSRKLLALAAAAAQILYLLLLL